MHTYLIKTPLVSTAMLAVLRLSSAESCYTLKVGLHQSEAIRTGARNSRVENEEE